MYFSLPFKNGGDDIVGRGRACTTLFLASQWTNEVYFFTAAIMIYKNASKLVTAAAFASESYLSNFGT